MSLHCIAQNLLRLRKEQGLTQAQLSQRSDVSLSQIRLIEKGVCNPTAGTIGRLAVALGVRSSTLMLRPEDAAAAEPRSPMPDPTPLLKLLEQFPEDRRPDAMRALCQHAALLLHWSKTDQSST